MTIINRGAKEDAAAYYYVARKLKKYELGTYLVAKDIQKVNKVFSIHPVKQRNFLHLGT